MSFDRLPFADLDVKLSEHLVEAHYVDRVRSWRERLLSWPWRPWLRLEQVRSFRPSSRAVMIDERTIVLHPATYEKLKRFQAGQNAYDAAAYKVPIRFDGPIRKDRGIYGIITDGN